MVAVIVLVGLLMVFSICALAWVMIKPEDQPLPGLRPHTTDRP